MLLPAAFVAVSLNVADSRACALRSRRARFGTLTFSTRLFPASTERLTALSLMVRRFALWPLRFLGLAVILPLSRTVAARSQVTRSLSVWGFGITTVEPSGLSLQAVFRIG